MLKCCWKKHGYLESLKCSHLFCFQFSRVLWHEKRKVMIYCSHYDKPEQRRQRWRICQTATGEECVPRKWHDLSWTMHYTREQVFPCRATRTICNVHFNQQTQLSCNLCQELQRTVCHYYAHKKIDIGFFSAAPFLLIKVWPRHIFGLLPCFVDVHSTQYQGTRFI